MMLNQNGIIVKDFKSYNYCCYVRCVTIIKRVVGMPWLQTGATHYHAQCVLPDKVHAIKVLVIYYVV